jgi:hypothetical protein
MQSIWSESWKSSEFITTKIAFTSRSVAALQENDLANRYPPMPSLTTMLGGTIAAVCFRCQVEIVRLKWALDFVVTPTVRQSGIGNVDPARLGKHIDIVTEGFQLPRKLPSEAVFDPQFLPPAAERQIKGL